MGKAGHSQKPALWSLPGLGTEAAGQDQQRCVCRCGSTLGPPCSQEQRVKEAQPLLGLLWAAWPCGTAEEEEEVRGNSSCPGLSKHI